MSEHVTISLSADQLETARREAGRLGVSVETFIEEVVAGRLAVAPSLEPRKKLPISALFGIVPASAGEPTDIAKDKDKLIGEAVWKEHLRKTRQQE